METGYADILANTNVVKKSAVHNPVPSWLMNYEDARPRWVTEVAAECLGVFAYVYCGIGATASLFISVATKEGPAFGSLLTVGFGYGVGIIFAILIAGPVSGGHLSPVRQLHILRTLICIDHFLLSRVIPLVSGFFEGFRLRRYRITSLLKF
jgi:hypothetical protein